MTFPMSRSPIHLAAVLALCTAILSVGSGCGDDDFEIRGEWRGELHQQGLAPFHVEATIESLRKSRRNTVHYTEIDCSGNWTFLDRRKGTYRFREVIDRGATATCKSVGTVTLTPRGEDRLSYRFQGGGVVSRGVLSRA